MRDWSVDEVLEHLRQGRAVRDANVAGLLDLDSLAVGDARRVNVPVLFLDCHLGGLLAPVLEFSEPVVLERTVIRGAVSFPSGYFLRGLRVGACRFESDADFACGGHNAEDAAFALIDSHFAGFVNFFDCWFQGPVEVRRCAFAGGTNLRGNTRQPYEVRFDVPPVIEGVTGVLDLPVG
jgi:hypothetical protein